jgi:enoyl-[acyl-carrier protein] reductase I
MNPLSAFDLKGKKGLILGLASEHSIAWGCARQAQAMGAEVVATCLNDKARAYVEPLTQPLGIDLQTCNIETPEELEKLVANAIAKFGRLDFVIHSIAWAPLQDLHGRVIDSSSEGFARAMEVSCHSFATLAKLCAPHMPRGGSMLTMSYLGADEAERSGEGRGDIALAGFHAAALQAAPLGAAAAEVDEREIRGCLDQAGHLRTHAIHAIHHRLHGEDQHALRFGLQSRDGAVFELRGADLQSGLEALKLLADDLSLLGELFGKDSFIEHRDAGDATGRNRIASTATAPFGHRDGFAPHAAKSRATSLIALPRPSWICRPE